MQTRLHDAVISGIGAYVPPRVMTNRDLEALVETNEEWILSRTGIKERRILEEGKGSSDMAVPAAQQALERAGVKAEDVGLVIVASITPDYVFPATACLVQDRLGMKRSAGYDLSGACSGFIFALTTGAQYIQTGMFEHVLVIGADANSRLVDWTDRGTCVIFGDGASAVVLSRSSSGRGIRSSYMRTDGSGLKHLYQPGGGSVQPPTVDSVQSRQHHIKMNGKETFKFAARAMTEAANEAVRQAGIHMEDISLLVPHQANIRIIEASAARLGMRDDQVIINIDRYGNTVAASIGLALNEAYETGRVKDDDYLLLVGFGAGLTWGSVVVRWGP